MKHLRYLGVELEENGKEEAKISDRIEEIIELYYAVNKKFVGAKEISRKVKINVNKSVYRPVMTASSL